MSDQATENLVQFISHFTGLLERQLEVIQGIMQQATESVMKGAMNIHSLACTSKENAESLMVKIMTEPDPGTSSMINDLQNAVTDVFEAASQKISEGRDAYEVETSLADKLAQQLANVDTSLLPQENMKEIAQNVQNMIIEMMATLSAEDVMVQRIDHVVLALKGLETTLNYILLDYHQRGSQEHLHLLMNDLKKYTFKQYTSEEEKEEFFEFFSMTDTDAA